jgi:signal transduction histidine kinase
VVPARWSTGVLGPLPTSAATSDNGHVSDERRGPAARPGQVRDAVELWRWARPRAAVAGLGLVTAVVGFVAGLVLLVLSVVSLALLAAGIGWYLLPPVTAGVRALLGEQRRASGAWFGVVVDVPYRPAREFGAYLGGGAFRRCRWLLADPATWRDLAWLLLGPAWLLLGVVPAALLAEGVEGMVVSPVLTPLYQGVGPGIGWFVTGPAWLMVPVELAQGVLMVAAGLLVARPVLRWRALAARWLLAPTRAARLALRVDQLTRTRSETVDAQAAELRRIERDLHDGAQARLVALGMNLGLAEELMARDPVTAQKLLAEARESSDRALTELRDLVRGIHPPVLAERGLDGAIRALALTLPLPVDVDIDLLGRPEAPLETAAYFAVAEALTNVAKHSDAEHAWVHLRHDGGRLLLTVRDDGRGGAAATPGSGLAGIERRLAAHDGTLTIDSPRGGPTILAMDIPCTLGAAR